MAQIRKRGPQQYQARIRLKGQPEVSKTFHSRSDAVEWTRDTEKQLQQNLGEITSLTWQQIHLDKRMVFLADTKNGESRQVPLSVRVFEYLENLGNREGRLLKRHPD